MVQTKDRSSSSSSSSLTAIASSSSSSSSCSLTPCQNATSKRPISIIVRVRPFLPSETIDDTISFPEDDRGGVGEGVRQGSTILVKNLRDPTVRFRYRDFSAVHGPEDDQEVFFQTSILPLLADLLMGRNLTLFCYGVTGSGKTWTMVGVGEDHAEQGGGSKAGEVKPPPPPPPRSRRSKYSDGWEVASEGEGVTPRLVRWLMSQKQEREMIRLGKKKKSRSKKGQEEDERKAKEFIKVEMECYEIYNEMVFDLLVQGRNGTGLPVRESGDRKVFVAGLTCKDVGDYREFVSLFGKANANRSTGSTNLNACSSRSHMVISLIVTARFEEGGGESVKVCTSRVNLVDLAGSENNKLTGNNKERLTESSAINKSLFVLGQVVQALNAGAPRIPYRDSKMTMIMRDALGGGGGSGPSSSTSSSRSHGVLIANLAPGSKFYNDSVATLNFASRTKTIENRVGSNMVHSSSSFSTTMNDATTCGTSVVTSSAAKPNPTAASVSSKRVPLAPRNIITSTVKGHREAGLDPPSGKGEVKESIEEAKAILQQGKKRTVARCGVGGGDVGEARKNKMAKMDHGDERAGVKAKAPPTSAPASSSSASAMRRMIREERPRMTEEELEAKVFELIERKLREKQEEEQQGRKVRSSATMMDSSSGVQVRIEEGSSTRRGGGVAKKPSQGTSHLVSVPILGTASDITAEGKRAREEELEARLEILERRLEAQQKVSPVRPTPTADSTRSSARDYVENPASALPALLSPATRNKTAKAALTLAREAESKGGVESLKQALAHYEQGLLYAPSNEKLRARVGECREAIRQGLDLKQFRAIKRKEALASKRHAPDPAYDAILKSKSCLPPNLPAQHLDVQVRMLGVEEGPKSASSSLRAKARRVIVKPGQEEREEEDEQIRDFVPPSQEEKKAAAGEGEKFPDLGVKLISTSQKGDDEEGSMADSRKRLLVGKKVAIAACQPRPLVKRLRRSSTEHNVESKKARGKRGGKAGSDPYIVPTSDEEESVEMVKKAKRILAATKARAAAEAGETDPFGSRIESSTSHDSAEGKASHLEVVGATEDEEEEEDVEESDPLAPPTIQVDLSKYAFVSRSLSLEGRSDPDGLTMCSSTSDPSTSKVTSTSPLPSLTCKDKAKGGRVKRAKPSTPKEGKVARKRASKSHEAGTVQDRIETVDPDPDAPDGERHSIQEVKVDVSLLPMASIRTLRSCPICSNPFPEKKTGPSKVAHLEYCARKNRLGQGVFDNLLQSEIERVRKAKLEMEIKGIEERTLLESLLIGKEINVLQKGRGKVRGGGGGGGRAGKAKAKGEGGGVGDEGKEEEEEEDDLERRVKRLKKTNVSNDRKTSSILPPLVSRSIARAKAEALLGPEAVVASDDADDDDDEGGGGGERYVAGSEDDGEDDEEGDQEGGRDEMDLPRGTQSFGESKLASRRGLSRRGNGLGLGFGFGTRSIREEEEEEEEYDDGGGDDQDQDYQPDEVDDLSYR